MTNKQKCSPFLLPNLFVDYDVLSLSYYVILSSNCLSSIKLLSLLHDMIQIKQQKCRFFFFFGSRQCEVFLSHLQKANPKSPFNQRGNCHWRNKKDWQYENLKKTYHLGLQGFNREILHDLSNSEERWGRQHEFSYNLKISLMLQSQIPDVIWAIRITKDNINLEGLSMCQLCRLQIYS